jgi:oxalate---CoA ligase
VDGQAICELLRGGTAQSLVTPDDETVLTHAQFAAHVESLAGRLAQAGVRRGDRVALVVSAGPEIVELVFALAALGAAAAPLNPAYTRDEFAFYLADLQPQLLIAPHRGAQAARSAASQHVGIVDLLSGQDSVPKLLLRGRELVSESAFEAGAADDIALLLHTSGTTSRPKQVPLLQRNIMASTRTVAEHYRLTADDVSYCAMPLFHIHGLVASTLAALFAGGSVVLARRVAPRRFWMQAQHAELTWFSAGPTIHQMLLDQFDAAGPPSSLRFVRSCSSALAPALMERAENTYGVPMLEAYGMTEASHQMSSNPLPPLPRLAGSVGTATGTEIRILDPDGHSLPDGETGEVAIRGPGVTSGYLDNPEANAEAFVDDWFRTGDLGVLEAGYLRLQGRLKELIIRGGENISPEEIEDVLKAHPSVDDAVCFGAPDAKYGEEVAAAVTLSAEANERELIEHCRDRLTAVKVPSRLYLVASIPRTATGKLQRRRIADSLLSQDA